MNYQLERVVLPVEYESIRCTKLTYIGHSVVPELREQFGREVAQYAKVEIEGDIVRISLDPDAELKQTFKTVQAELIRCINHGIAMKTRVKQFESLGFFDLLRLAFLRLYVRR